MSRNVLLVLLLATDVVLADDAPKAKRLPRPPRRSLRRRRRQEVSGHVRSGKSGSAKALVIVPWKSSEIGASLGISTMLDDSKQPIDKDVFMRALSYYEIRSKTDAAQPAAAAHRRSS
jgi:hypothetical protein